jgi:hypothetical protein
MSKTTVVRAYMSDGQQMQRVLADSRGNVYVGKEWTRPTGQLIPVRGIYERWSDVPEAWIGHVPFWK